MLSTLPPNVPPNFRSIDRAEFAGSGVLRTVVADLTMFDGLAATVEVFSHGLGSTGHRWLAWQGDDVSFEKGGWQRVKRVDGDAAVLAAPEAPTAAEGENATEQQRRAPRPPGL